MPNSPRRQGVLGRGSENRSAADRQREGFGGCVGVRKLRSSIAARAEAFNAVAKVVEVVDLTGEEPLFTGNEMRKRLRAGLRLAPRRTSPVGEVLSAGLAHPGGSADSDSADVVIEDAAAPPSEGFGTPPGTSGDEALPMAQPVHAEGENTQVPQQPTAPQYDVFGYLGRVRAYNYLASIDFDAIKFINGEETDINKLTNPDRLRGVRIGTSKQGVVKKELLIGEKIALWEQFKIENTITGGIEGIDYILNNTVNPEVKNAVRAQVNYYTAKARHDFAHPPVQRQQGRAVPQTARLESFGFVPRPGAAQAVPLSPGSRDDAARLATRRKAEAGITAYFKPAGAGAGAARG